MKWMRWSRHVKGGHKVSTQIKKPFPEYENGFFFITFVLSLIDQFQFLVTRFNSFQIQRN